MTRKKKKSKSNTHRFSFLFLFMFCRKRKRSESVLIHDYDDERFEIESAERKCCKIETQDLFETDTNTMKEKCYTADQKPSEKNDRIYIRDSSILSTPSVSSKRSRSSASLKLLSPRSAVRNLRKFSPRKKRIALVSQSKCAALNSHVTVELARIESSENLESRLATKSTDDKQPLLTFSEQDSESNVCSRDEESPRSKPREVRRSKSLSDQQVWLPKKRSTSKLTMGVFHAKASRKKQSSEERRRSVGDINQNENADSFLEKARLKGENVVASKGDETVPGNENRLEEVTFRNLALKNKPNISKRISTVCQIVDNDDRKKVTNRSEIKNSLTEQLIKLTSLDPPKQRPSRKKSRPYSCADLKGESDYVMLNPLPPQIKSPTRNRIPSPDTGRSTRSDFGKFPFKNIVSPSKSLSSLPPSSKTSFQEENPCDSFQMQSHSNSLFASPGIDYRAEVNEVLTQLRRSLRKQERFDQSYLDNQSDFSPGFPIKKSKSVEPLTALDQRCTHTIDGQRPAAANRSRSRVKYIARKYSMYTSNENVSGVRSSSFSERQSASNWGHGDYVYLSQTPKSASYEKQSLNGDYPTWSTSVPSRRKPTNFRRKNSSNNPDESDVIMTSQTGDYYHLNVIVQNSYRNKLANELECVEQSRRNDFDDDDARKPHVFYSLDV